MQFDSESAEAEFMYQYALAAPETLGVSARRLAGGVVMHMRNDPMSYWSKALGFDQDVTPGLLDEILGFYAGCGATSAVLQFTPGLLPGGFAAEAAARGITAGTTWAKLGCEVSEVLPAGSTGLRVGRVAPEQAGEWGETVLRAFGVPGTPLSQMVAGAVSAPGFQAFAAWDGDVMVAGGGLLVHGEVGSLHTGATLPEHRGRGAQSALIAARAEAARRAGCRWLTSETGVPEPGRGNSSLNNLRRAGLRVLYERPNWRWNA
ncbi:hypothetical protein KIH74_22070 [Kineosporia sp. J2-2]|uniref:N-acetyltransferase domain-containing protein n=1 Tax=Kineosporia corallincola TaxID=2835133 RepID=A0ABS5TKL2_9ACTN|nr:GNAT family N-acetyltransferase [Kineosporia corallincola]MBT0771642.1 hypothetical protein [Kineosporia corallincola]